MTDDGALIDLGPSETLAVTADTLIEGRHFPMGAEAGLAARKALRTNLSDLAAMGARPFGYVLNIVWPEERAASRIEAFAAGLALDQAEFGVRLLGGDTTRSPGPWTISVTAFGRRPSGLALRRSGVRAGDHLVATGHIGDACLGLKALQGAQLALAAELIEHLKRRSNLPEPRLQALPAMRRHASAAIDVSDGLLADARHLAVQSRLALELDLALMPVSQAAAAWLGTLNDEVAGRLELAAGGDDYELLLATADPAALIAELAEVQIPAIELGRFTSGPGTVSVYHEGRPITPQAWGFTHF